MPVKETIVCTRCGAEAPYSMSNRIKMSRLVFSEVHYGIFDALTEHTIDLCNDCKRDFEEFVYRYKGPHE